MQCVLDSYFSIEKNSFEFFSLIELNRTIKLLITIAAVANKGVNKPDTARAIPVIL